MAVSMWVALTSTCGISVVKLLSDGDESIGKSVSKDRGCPPYNREVADIMKKWD